MQSNGAGALSGRQFPTTSAAWSTAFPTIATPTSIWALQAASAPLNDTVGSNHLDTAVGTPIYAQAGDPLGRLAFGLDANSEGVTCTVSTEANITTQDFSVYFRILIPNNTGGNRGLFGKRAAGAGWYCGYFNSNGKVFFLTDNGVASSFAQTATDLADGGWHDVLCTRDADGNLSIHVDSATVTAASVGGSLTNTELFSLGSTSAIAAAGMRASYGAFWDGTVITSAQWNTIRGV